MTDKEYNSILTGYKNGVFKILRLSRLGQRGEREVIVAFNKKHDEKNFENKLKEIRYMCENNLPPGAYQIECKNGLHPSSLLRVFNVEVKEPKKPTMLITEPMNGQKIETAEIFEGMTQREFMDKYLELTTENANIKAQLQVKDIEIRLLQEKLNVYQKYEINNPAMGDPASVAGNATGSVMNTLKDIASMGIPLLEKYFEQQDRKITLQENMTSKSNSMPKQQPHTKTKSSYPGSERQTYLNQLLAEFGKLEESDSDECDKQLDELQAKDPEAYKYVMDGLGLEDSPEESN